MPKSLSFMPCLTLFLLLPIAASAHDGHTHGFGQGFAHPFAGIDHLLAMLAVGCWSAAALPGRWWLVPTTFAVAVFAGAVLAMNVAIAMDGIEIVIALSLLMLGVLMFARTPFSPATASIIVAMMGLVHGMAHGSELPLHAAAQSWLAGMLFATLLLHLAGAAIGRMARTSSPWLARAGGSAIAATGVVLLYSLILS